MTGARPTTLDVATIAMTVAIAALAAWVAIFGPSGPYPMQIGMDGEVNRWGSRTAFVSLLVFMSAMCAIGAGMMGWYARSSDEPRARSLRVGQLVSLIAIGGSTVMAAWVGLGGLLQIGSPPAAASAASLGIILVLVGGLLGRVGPNPVVGVRTPWTYKSRLAWDRSNRLAGRLMFWIGLIALITAPFAPQPVGMFAAIAAVLGAAAWSVFESWRVWRADPDRQPF